MRARHNAKSIKAKVRGFNSKQNVTNSKVRGQAERQKFCQGQGKNAKIVSQGNTLQLLQSDLK